MASDLTPEELLPCPFCGEQRAKVKIDNAAYIGGYDRIVLCRNCGANGANCITEAEAITAWNTRPATPPAHESRVPTDQAGLEAKLRFMARHERKDGSKRDAETLDAAADAIAALSPVPASAYQVMPPPLRAEVDDLLRFWKQDAEADGHALIANRNTIRRFVAVVEALTKSPPQETVEAIIEALTPSGDTKAAYMGEFSFTLPEADEDGEEYSRKFYVPWDTIKEIMAAIRNRALKPEQLTSTLNEVG